VLNRYFCGSPSNLFYPIGTSQLSDLNIEEGAWKVGNGVAVELQYLNRNLIKLDFEEEVKEGLPLIDLSLFN
jgi:hypothetical protein